MSAKPVSILPASTITALLEPLTTARWSVHDTAWVAQLRARQRRLRWGAWRRRWTPWRRRTRASVRAEYERVWSRPYPNLAVPTGGVHVVWDGHVHRIGKLTINRFYVALLHAILERVRPRTVLDLGCGHGMNTLILAAMHPSIRFTGVELTATGLARARDVQRGLLPRGFSKLAPAPLVDATAHQRVQWVQADASRLPLKAAAVDMVISCLALEQMDSVRQEVLRELRRVAAAGYVGIEPFADWNTASPKQDYITNYSYWRGDLAELEGAGFTVRESSDAFPQKVLFGVGLVWAEIR